jgi:hypothetical protein
MAKTSNNALAYNAPFINTGRKKAGGYMSIFYPQKPRIGRF